jgi:hypothetical protein
MATQNAISRQQTELIRLQSLAEQSNMYRQLQLDINGINRVVGDIATAKAGYDYAKDETVRVKERILVNGSPKPFDLDVKANGFSLSLCNERYQSYVPRPLYLSKCEDSTPSDTSIAAKYSTAVPPRCLGPTRSDPVHATL